MAQLIRSIGADHHYTGQLAGTAQAQLLVPADPKRQTVFVTNTGGGTLYLGNAGVTTANGYPITTGNTAQWPSTDAVYIVGATGVGAWAAFTNQPPNANGSAPYGN